MIPTRTAEDLIAGHWQLLRRFGAVPRELVWDQEGAVGAWRRGKPALTEAFEAFRGMLGTSVRLCRAAPPAGQGPGGAQQRLLRTLVPARAGVHVPGGLQYPDPRVDHLPGQRAPPPGAGLPADPAVGGGQGRDAAAAPGGTDAGLAAFGAPAPGPLRPGGCQRLLGGPAGDRPPGRGARRPAPRAGLRRRAAGRRPRPLLGRAPEHHRPGACRRGGRAAGRGPPAPGSEDADQVEVRDLSTYDRVFGVDGQVA